MMSFASLEGVIPKIYKNIYFQEYLIDNGYKIQAKKNIKGFICFSKTFNLLGEDVVFVGNNKTNEIYYSKLFNDSGTIIDFVKNRIELEKEYETFAPNKDHFVEAIRKLVEYINDKGENTFKTDYNTTKDDLQLLKHNTFTKYYNAVLITDTKYLESFNISPSIINHPIFKNTIYNSRGLIYNEEQLDVINTAFPLFNESGKECGLYFENNIEKRKKVEAIIEFFAPGTIQTGLWQSNKYSMGTNTKTKVTLVNNPKDALAHFSYLKENRFYLATFKQDETTYEHIKSILIRQRSSLYLAGNVSVQNFVNEIKIIIHLLDANLEFVKENYETIIIKIGSNEKKYFEKLMKYIRKNNATKFEEIIKTLGTDAKAHLKDDLIVPTEDKDSNIYIKIPKNFKTLYYLQQILIKTFPSYFDINIEKPMYLNWTIQNMKFRNAVEENLEHHDMIEKYIEDEKIFILSN